MMSGQELIYHQSFLYTWAPAVSGLAENRGVLFREATLWGSIVAYRLPVECVVGAKYSILLVAVLAAW